MTYAKLQTEITLLLKCRVFKLLLGDQAAPSLIMIFKLQFEITAFEIQTEITSAPKNNMISVFKL